MQFRIFPIIFSLLVLSACAVEPIPIEYGKDACTFCKMNIVDQQHAAEIVTKKGKAFKYDCIECMLNDLKAKNEAEIELFLVNTYDSPKSLSDALKSTFLISEGISSPMGENLTAFKDIATAKSTKDEKGGELYDWRQLKIKFTSK